MKPTKGETGQNIIMIRFFVDWTGHLVSFIASHSSLYLSRHRTSHFPSVDIVVIGDNYSHLNFILNINQQNVVVNN